MCFDAAPTRLLTIASTFARMLQCVDGVEVRRCLLGSAEQEEGLWTALDWTGEQGALYPIPVPGRLGPPPPGTLTLVVVPDIARLSLVAARAAVTLVGSDVAHIERDSISVAWRPTIAWLAGCATSDIGRVSPHLLDRFAVRLRVPEATSSVGAVGDSRADPGARPEDDDVEVFAELIDDLLGARGRTARVTREALVAVLSLVPADSVGARREIALARLAAGAARLDAAEEVTSGHARSAAALLGIAPPALETPATDSPAPQDEPITTSVLNRTTPAAAERSADTQRIQPPQPPLTPNADTRLEASALADLGRHDSVNRGPYPEDDAPMDRELAPLREPPIRATYRAVGTPIGIQQARGLQDLALTSTVLEAAKFQMLRRRSRPQATGLLVTAADLRSYRRSPPAEEMLALVLDFTCRGDWTWTTVLQPYLAWAYPRRASVCLVRVGARDAANELQAERVMARNLLDPKLALLLEAPAGRATPLAHGLELARQALRHSLHHGRAELSSARLVVVTDGRGNIPLDASRGGRIEGAVAQRGVDDALLVAEQLAALDRVRATVIDPAPTVLADLPRELARALNAELDASIAARKVAVHVS